MKILMIVPGGVHRSGRMCVIPALLAFLKRLAERHEVTVIALRQYPDFRRYALLNAQVFNLGFSPHLPGIMNTCMRAYRLSGILKERQGKFDLVHAFWLTEPGFLAWITGRKMKIPVVTSLGGGELVWLPDIKYGNGRYRINRACIRRIMHSAAAVTAGSRYALNPVQAHRSDAKWVPLFPEAEPFRELSPSGDGPPWRLLHVSSINRPKDPWTLLKALKRVVEQNRKTVLDWVGEDTLGGSVQRLAEELGLGNYICFHGYITNNALPEYYAKAHVYVQSSRYESQGVSVCEAAAAGLPVVGTDVGLVHELAPDKAVAVPVSDAKALGNAILKLLDDPARRMEMGGRARNWAASHTADWTAQTFESIYRDILSHPVEWQRERKRN